MKTKKTFHYTLDIAFEVHGPLPSDAELHDRLMDALNDRMPTVIDREDDDYAICIDEWEYT